jgi:hypothetical protein
MNQEQIFKKVREIAAFSEPFQVIFNQNKAPYPKMESDWLQALQFYLHGYAYERQGRSLEYSTAAVEAAELAKFTSKKPDSEFPNRVWAAFLQILRLPKSKGANPKMNPLFPQDNLGKTAITNLILTLEDIDYNIINYVLILLKQGLVEKAHQFLCRIRGTGNKINSLFLRDIVLMYNLPLVENLQLQPVDIWVRRLVRLLMGFPPDAAKDVKDAYSDDVKIAESIIILSKKAGISPLLFNQGAWYFGAQIAQTKNRLIQYIEDKLDLKDAINHRILSLEQQTNALRILNRKF